MSSPQHPLEVGSQAIIGIRINRFAMYFIFTGTGMILEGFTHPQGIL